MKKIKIYSPYPCLIRQGQEQIEIESNEGVCLESDLLPLKVYPLKTTNKVYAFEIDSFCKDNHFYRIANSQGETLIFLLDGLLTENVNVYHFSYLDYNSTLEIYTDKLVFAGEGHKKIIYLKNKPISTIAGNFKFIDYAKIVCQNRQTLVCYNVKVGNAKTFEGKEITITENGFNVENEDGGIYDNMSKSYYVDDDGLKPQNQVYTLSTHTIPDKLVAFNFITLVKNGTLDDALKFLSPSLRKTIKSENLKQYFGNLEYVFMIDGESAFAIKNGNNIIYSFKINDGKIDEIYDNQ